MWSPLAGATPEGDSMEGDNGEEEEEGAWPPPAPPVLMWPVLQARTGLVYDQRMMDHYNLWDKYAVGEPG